MSNHFIPNSPGAFLLGPRPRGQGNGQRPRQLGDYPAQLPNQIVRTQGSEGLGPLVTPTQVGESAGWLEELLARLPIALSMEARTRFQITPREAVAFAEGAAPVTVGAGLTATLVRFEVEEGYAGFITQLGLSTFPAAAMTDITWQLRIGGAAHPNMNGNVYAAPSFGVGSFFNFPCEVTQNKIVELFAINTSAVPVDASGIIIGWTEYLSGFKQYGSSPQTGIG